METVMECGGDSTVSFPQKSPLDLLKRALYSFNSLIPSKEPYISSKEPYIPPF